METNQNGTAETRTVDNDNQYDSITGLTPAYDVNGNMTGFDGKTYVYDWANRLIQVKQGSIVQQEYFYDALNRRVQSKDYTGAAVAATEYIYHGSKVIEEYKDGSFDKAFVYADYMGLTALSNYTSSYDLDYGSTTNFMPTLANVNPSSYNMNQSAPSNSANDIFDYEIGNITALNTNSGVVAADNGFFDAYKVNPVANYGVNQSSSAINNNDLFKNNPSNFQSNDGYYGIVLNRSTGAGGAGHNAISLGNDVKGTGFHLYSKNGYDDPHGINEGQYRFRDFNDFVSVNNTQVRTETVSGGPYNQMVKIKINQKQYEAMTDAALKSVNNPYNLYEEKIYNYLERVPTKRQNCSNLVYDALRAGDIPTSQKTVPRFQFNELIDTMNELNRERDYLIKISGGKADGNGSLRGF